MQGIPSKFQDRCICNSLDRQFFSTNLKQVGCIEEAFSVDDTKNDNISLILCQVVAVKKYYSVLPAVPKNSSERRKTVLRAAQ